MIVVCKNERAQVRYEKGDTDNLKTMGHAIKKQPMARRATKFAKRCSRNGKIKKLYDSVILELKK